MQQPLPRLGSDKAKVVVVLDPVVSDRKFNSPLRGSDLEWLGPRIIENTGLDEADIQFLSCARSVTFEENDSNKITGEILKEYSEQFVETVRDIAPDLIITMGAKATRQVVGRSVQITKVRGQTIDETEHFGSTPVFPMTSPFFARRHPESENIFIADLQTIGRIATANFDPESAYSKIKTDYRWCFDIDFLLKDPPKLLVLDTETKGLLPHMPETRLLTVQITTEEGNGYCIPIEYDAGDLRIHKKITFPGGYRKYIKRIRRQLKTLLENPDVRVVGQNLAFDWKILYYKMGIEIARYHGDTILMAHLLDENLMSKSLADLTRLHVPELAGYSDEFDKDPIHKGKTRMDLVPPDDMLAYGCGDTDVTLRLYNQLLPKLREDRRLYQCYKKTVMRAVRAFCYMEMEGFHIDRKELESFEADLAAHQDNERKWILSQIPESIKAIHRDTGVGLKPDRAVLLIDYLFEHPDGLNLEPRVRTKTGKPSVSSKLVMPHYVADYPVIARLVDYIKNEKMLSTYLRGFYKYIVDGRIFPSYALFKTTTGRAACVHEDTLIPTRRGDVRIADIKIGDFVKTHKNRWRRVKAKYVKPVQDMYEVTFSDGSTIRCTEEHRFYTNEGTWESLRNVCIKARFGESEFAAADSSPLHRIFEDHDTGVRAYRNDNEHGYSDSPRGLGGRNLSGIQKSKILGVEKGAQKPHEGKETGEPQTGRVSSGWVWIPDDSHRQKTLLRASGCDGASLRDTPRRPSAESARSSHRRESAKQRTEQSGVNDGSSASRDSHEAGRELPRVSITKIHHCGRYPVFDIGVEQDHSYAACGVLNHNSSEPNGQNFPKRGKMAKRFRKAFKAPKGWVYVSVDLSQAEIRIAAALSRDETMMKVYQEGGDIHRMTAAGVMGLTLKAFMALDKEIQDRERFHAKAVNFGFLYGMWWRKFREYAKTDYGIDFTDEEAQHIREMFFQTYARIGEWHEAAKAFVRKHKYVRAYNGRIRHLPMIDSTDEAISKQAERQAINSPVQAFASDLGLMAIGLLVPYLRKTKLWNHIKVCGFVHDAVIVLVREEYATRAIRLVKSYMENVPLKSWFDLDFPVPIVADAEIGRDLAEMHEIPEWVFAKGSGVRSYEDILETLCIDESKTVKKPKKPIVRKPPIRQTKRTSTEPRHAKRKTVKRVNVRTRKVS